jgi:hypothetical protein
MCSRAVALIGRNLERPGPGAASPRAALGAVWTRTGRPFFTRSGRRTGRPAAQRCRTDCASMPDAIRLPT